MDGGNGAVLELGGNDPSTPRGKHDLWRKRLSEAEQQRAPYLKRWLRLRTYYIYGTDAETINNALRSGNDVVRVNRAHAFVRTILPRIMFRAPRVDASPRRKGDEGAALSAGLVMNYLFDELDVEEQMRLSVLDALIFGFGYVKFGFDSEWGVDPEEAEKRVAASAKLAALGEDLAMLRSLAGLAPQPERVAGARERTSRQRLAHPDVDFNDHVIREMPWVLRGSPFDILVDPTAARFADAQWIAHRMIRPVEDAKKDDRYGAVRKNLRGGTYVKSFETVLDRLGDARYSRDIQHSGSTPSEIIHSIARDPVAGFEKIGGLIPDQVEIWEVWDKRLGEVVTLERSLDEPLIPGDENPFEMEGLPFEFNVFNEVPDRLWPKSDLEDIFPQNLELNDIRQYSIQWFRKMVKSVIAYTEGQLDEKQLENLTGPDPFVLLSIKGQSIESTLKMIDLGRFDPGVYEIEERLEKDMRETIGLGAEQTGEPVGNITATASANAAAATDIRIEDKKRQVERFGKRIARKLLQVTRQFFPQEVALRIGGADAADWRTVTKEELQREFDIRIEVDSATKPRDEVARQQWSEMIDRSLAVAGATGLQFDWGEIMKRYFAKFGIDKPDDLVLGVMPAIDPATGLPAVPGMPGSAQMPQPAEAMGGAGGPGGAPFGPQPVAGGEVQQPGRFAQVLQAMAANGGQPR